jgi:inositol phosphorylceramide glucuronosyltransferase 1
MQFPNGTHSKLSSYFGAISVIVCFLSAGVSFAFAFTIIPRQVMPWTGLLLVFEWTFVSFFLIFGSYLRFAYRWGSASSNHAGFSNSDSSENHMGTGMLIYIASSDFQNFLLLCSKKYFWSLAGHQRNSSDCDTDATFYWTGMAVIATVAVLLPTLLGITALFTK